MCHESKYRLKLWAKYHQDNLSLLQKYAFILDRAT